MLREIAEDIWVAEQPFRYFGLSVGTRMTVIRLANQELAVISPIQVSAALISQLDELGTVGHIIAPNLYHYLFAADFKRAHPTALFWAVPGLEAKKPDLPIDRIIGDEANFLQDGVEFVFFDGFRTLGLAGFEALNECVFFHRASRTLILTDAALNFDESFPVMTQLATRVLGAYKQLSPTLLERIATTEKETVRRSVKNVLSWDFERIIMAHGSLVERHGKEQLQRGYERFLGRPIGTGE
ncbi:hypothetical protein C7271_11635 [filamentous cyanobacterium CCP5]|nr:hypothetical protein C7271_11635 [filamentous cyanobacterium CCP5]